MTPDERNLITGLLGRLRGFGTVEKDRDAEALINAEVRQIPDSAYLLVQSVLVQEQSLSAANDRVQQLESRIRDLEATASHNSPQAKSGGGFLGGLFGGGTAPTSVPPSRPMAAPANSPWGQPAQPQAQQPQYQQPQYAQPPYQQPMQPASRAGGGFLAQAMSTAAGVAGGMMAADALRGMLGGGHHGSSFGLPGATADDASQNAAQDAAQDQDMAQDAAQNAAQDDAQDQEMARQDDSNDPGTTSSGDDGSSGWDSGGGDSSDA